MTEPKPFASLSASLLARKGGARPAMRRQIMPMNYDDEQRRTVVSPSARAEAAQDDLGWNDMGEDAGAFPAATPSEIDSCAAEIVAIAADPMPEPARPEVLRRIETLAGAVLDAASAGTTSASSKRRPRGAVLKDGRKVAFTLRLDAPRHLRLRLACTVSNRSAQQIVVEALDRFLETKPGLDDLARRVRQS